MAIAITYEIGPDDYVEAQRAYMAGRLYKAYVPLFMITGVTLISAGVWMAFWIGGPYPLFLILGVSALFVPAGQAAVGRRQYNKNAGLHERFTASIDAN